MCNLRGKRNFLLGPVVAEFTLLLMFLMILQCIGQILSNRLWLVLLRFPLQFVFRLFLADFQPISLNQIRFPGRVLRAMIPLIKIQIQRPLLFPAANVLQWATGLFPVLARGDVGLVLVMGTNNVGV
jgi:hypothetical protein